MRELILPIGGVHRVRAGGDEGLGAGLVAFLLRRFLGGVGRCFDHGRDCRDVRAPDGGEDAWIDAVGAASEQHLHAATRLGRVERHLQDAVEADDERGSRIVRVLPVRRGEVESVDGGGDLGFGSSARGVASVRHVEVGRFKLGRG